jgi:hypothetical protein
MAKHVAEILGSQDGLISLFVFPLVRCMAKNSYRLDLFSRPSHWLGVGLKISTGWTWFSFFNFLVWRWAKKKATLHRKCSFYVCTRKTPAIGFCTKQHSLDVLVPIQYYLLGVRV